jgi:hypothetical protein
VRDYVLSLAGVAALGFLLLVSMLLTAALAAIGKFMGDALPEPLMQAAGFAVSVAVISLMFALLLKWMPDADVRWRDVIEGAYRHRCVVRDGQACDQHLHRQAGTRVDLRGVGLDRDRFDLGVL